MQCIRRLFYSFDPKFCTIKLFDSNIKIRLYSQIFLRKSVDHKFKLELDFYIE